MSYNVVYVSVLVQFEIVHKMRGVNEMLNERKC